MTRIFILNDTHQNFVVGTKDESILKMTVLEPNQHKEFILEKSKTLFRAFPAYDVQSVQKFTANIEKMEDGQVYSLYEDCGVEPIACLELAAEKF